jgi:hypothetical protein
MRRLLVLTAVLFLTSAAVPRRGAEVHISFSGLICQIFDGQHAPRAVAMRGTPGMLHRATLHIPEASIASSDVAMTCGNGDCVVDLADTALRFPGAGRAHYDRGGSFDTVVPHLHSVTGGEMQSLRADVFDAVPSPAGVVSASMELPAGRMSATAYDAKAHYEPDFENRGDRPFAREVFLDGLLASPELLVRRAGERSWRSITFKDGVLIELRMVNEPAEAASGMRHETLFYDLSALPLATKPFIAAPSPAAGSVRTEMSTVACSNSNYP